ncbi:MAG: hypothetical protein QOE97_3689, partial [Pseudonocardiales bacterium]|nr:hypothetical protein [Pseudonocardiales bacterium]
MVETTVDLETGASAEELLGEMLDLHG